jgi:8-oxo-dGTP diphosphatase
MSRVANYCPRCGAALQPQERYGRSRPVCSACDFIVFFDPKVAVLALITHEDKILLVKRAIDPGAGKWACPAGFVEHDEDPADAVLRELQEETGLIGKIDRLLDVFPKKDEGLADIVIVYGLSVIGGELTAADDAEEVAWFGCDNLPELVFYPSITMVGRWCEGAL